MQLHSFGVEQPLLDSHTAITNLASLSVCHIAVSEHIIKLVSSLCPLLLHFIFVPGPSHLSWQQLSCNSRGKVSWPQAQHWRNPVSALQSLDQCLNFKADIIILYSFRQNCKCFQISKGLHYSPNVLIYCQLSTNCCPTYIWLFYPFAVLNNFCKVIIVAYSNFTYVWCIFMLIILSSNFHWAVVELLNTPVTKHLTFPENKHDLLFFII